MPSTALLADGARQYSGTFGRRWLVRSYEAVDVVLHATFAVSLLAHRAETWLIAAQIYISIMVYDLSNAAPIESSLGFMDGSKPWDKASPL